MTRLERASHVCVVVLCIVAIGAIVDQRIASRVRSTNRDVSGLIGKQLTLSTVVWNRAPLNVVVAMSIVHFAWQALRFTAAWPGWFMIPRPEEPR
ncbi:exported hypothetical protein [Candidatus Sulfopaludibacter sp. SbA3]|nr:exported hypothetical protein [Candidatus Sulfopaludibacter sp. SbA3]